LYLEIVVMQGRRLWHITTPPKENMAEVSVSKYII